LFRIGRNGNRDTATGKKDKAEAWRKKLQEAKNAAENPAKR
jgi:hypothetical protein